MTGQKAFAAALGVLAAAVVAVFVLQVGSDRVERPAATGQLGVLYAYGQFPEVGPRLLRPTTTVELPRPQHIAFEWAVEGTGPRIARIETEVDGARVVHHEVALTAPARSYLEFVLTLDETAPKSLDLLMTVEAPHTQSETAKIRIVLLGP